jgi:hypothetical protein
LPQCKAVHRRIILRSREDVFKLEWFTSDHRTKQSTSVSVDNTKFFVVRSCMVTGFTPKTRADKPMASDLEILRVPWSLRTDARNSNSISTIWVAWKSKLVGT